MKKIESSDIIIYGRNPVKEALNEGFLKRILLVNGFKDQNILSLIPKNLDIEFISVPEMDKISNGGVHQGVAAIRKPYSYASLDELIHKGSKRERSIIVILDGIEDPHNLGAILRSCDVFDVTGVIIPKHNCVSLNATVAKTSAGAINYIPVAPVTNLNNAIETLKNNGYWVVSSDGSAKINYGDIKYDFNVVLVIGSEGKGVSHLVLKNSDYIVKIPQYGHVNSLNASVACGVLLSKIRG